MRRLWPACRRRDPLERAIRDAAKKTDRAIDRLALTAAIEGEEVVDAIDRLTAAVKALSPPPTPTNQAVSCRLVVTEGDQVAATITVDTTDGTVTLEFQDDRGGPAAAPADATVVFDSDNPAVCAVAADATNPFQGNLAPASVGSFNLSATVTGTYANGTAIGSPAPLALAVTGGVAVSNLLVAAASN